MNRTITIRELIITSVLTIVLFSIPVMGYMIYKQNQLIEMQIEFIDNQIYKQ